MASDYGLNFGFRRSDESLLRREGRFKTPADGDALLLGSAVEIDPAEPGYLKQSAANAVAVVGLRGLLVQEDSHIGDIFSNSPDRGHDSYDLGYAKLDTLAIMVAGPGAKVWFRNSAAYSRGGRTRDAVTILAGSGLAVGDRLGWDGSKWVESDGTTIPHWMTVTQVSGSTTATYYAEAVISF